MKYIEILAQIVDLFLEFPRLALSLDSTRFASLPTALSHLRAPFNGFVARFASRLLLVILTFNDGLAQPGLRQAASPDPGQTVTGAETSPL